MIINLEDYAITIDRKTAEQMVQCATDYATAYTRLNLAEERYRYELPPDDVAINMQRFRIEANRAALDLAALVFDNIWQPFKRKKK